VKKDKQDYRAEKILQRGFDLWKDRGRILRFLTLTAMDVRGFRTNWRKLKRFLVTKMGDFEYFGVRTGEGLGVVHLVYVGKSVRYKELSNIWEKISGFWNVHISSVRNPTAVIKELTRQYKKIRYFSSRGWVNSAGVQESLMGDLMNVVYRETKFKFIS